MAYNKNLLLKYKDICDIHNHFTEIGLTPSNIYRKFIKPYFFITKTTYYKALGTNYKKELEKYDLKDIPRSGVYQLLVAKYSLVKETEKPIIFDSKKQQTFYILYFQEKKNIDKVCKFMKISKIYASELLIEISNKLNSQ